MKKLNNLLFVLGLLLILTITLYFQFSQIYPKTGDYIPYLIITQQISSTGFFSSFNPYHQLGVETSVQPAAPIIFSILSNITGINPLFIVKISTLFFILSFLSAVIFLRNYSNRLAILGGFTYCLLPLNLDLLSWGSLHSFIVLFLIPLFLYYLIQHNLV